MKWLVAIVAACALGMAVYMSTGKTVRAECKDGTISHSKHRPGTCSKHGGVAKWR